MSCHTATQCAKTHSTRSFINLLLSRVAWEQIKGFTEAKVDKLVDVAKKMHPNDFITGQPYTPTSHAAAAE